jgi:hypothetical protein
VLTITATISISFFVAGIINLVCAYPGDTTISCGIDFGIFTAFGLVFVGMLLGGA